MKKATDDNIVIYLVGNKADLIDSSNRNRKVTKEQAIQYSKFRHFQGFGECSALKDINIKEKVKDYLETDIYKLTMNMDDIADAREVINENIPVIEDNKLYGVLSA